LTAYVVDGLVNFVGVASIFSGESLKYTISGQSRNYLLTLFVGVLIALTALSWSFLGSPLTAIAQALAFALSSAVNILFCIRSPLQTIGFIVLSLLIWAPF